MQEYLFLVAVHIHYSWFRPPGCIYQNRSKMASATAIKGLTLVIVP